MLYNIYVALAIPETGFAHEDWVMADDCGTRSVFAIDAALEFIEMTAKRNGFVNVRMVPAVR